MSEVKAPKFKVGDVVYYLGDNDELVRTKISQVHTEAYSRYSIPESEGTQHERYIFGSVQELTDDKLKDLVDFISEGIEARASVAKEIVEFEKMSEKDVEKDYA